MTHFHDLQTLDLSWNDIGYTGEKGTMAIGQGLQYLPYLQTLDLSGNQIGYTGEKGTIAIGQGLQYLPHLQTLDLSLNQIGWTGENGIIAIGEGLKYLSHLQTLDLSNTFIGMRGEDGTIAIGDGLKYLPHLQTLDLSNNHIGFTRDNGTIAIGDGLKYLPNLQALDLSQNRIGDQGDNGTIAIGDGLKYLPNLQTLDLSGNYIGGSGAQSLFNDLPPLICQGLKTLGLQGNNFTDIPWSEAANALEGLYSAHIQQACEADRCFGTPIAVNTAAIKCKVQQSSKSSYNECSPLTSSASSLTLPFIFSPFAAFQKNALPLLPSPGHEDLPKGTEMVLYQEVHVPSFWNFFKERGEWGCQIEGGECSFTSVNLFSKSAAKGAAYTFGLEMMRDILEHGGVPKRVAHGAITATQVALIAYTATSYIPTMTGMAVNGGLSYMGASPSVSSTVGTTAAIMASIASGDIVTPTTLIVSVGGSMLGSNLAFKAKEKVSSWLWKKETVAKGIPKIKSS